MSNIQQFVDLVGQGENIQAQEVLNNILSAKAFESLEAYKQNIAANMFTTEETEQVDEESEQLDEISAGKGTAAYIERLKRANKATSMKDSDKHTDKAIDNISRLHNQHGRVASRAAEKKARDLDLM